MARQWEQDGDDDVMGAALRILVVTYSIERMIQTVRGSAMELMRRAKDIPSTSTVSGLPCAAEFVWDPRDEEPQPAEVHDASAAIPAHVIEKLDRCAE